MEEEGGRCDLQQFFISRIRVRSVQRDDHVEVFVHIYKKKEEKKGINTEVRKGKKKEGEKKD